MKTLEQLLELEKEALAKAILRAYEALELFDWYVRREVPGTWITGGELALTDIENILSGVRE